MDTNSTERKEMKDQQTELVITTEGETVVFYEEEVDDNARGFYNIGNK